MSPIFPCDDCAAILPVDHSCPDAVPGYHHRDLTHLTCRCGQHPWAYRGRLGWWVGCDGCDQAEHEPVRRPTLAEAIAAWSEPAAIAS